MANGGLIDRTAATAPTAWRRHLSYVLAGLHAPRSALAAPSPARTRSSPRCRHSPTARVHVSAAGTAAETCPWPASMNCLDLRAARSPAVTGASSWSESNVPSGPVGSPRPQRRQATGPYVTERCSGLTDADSVDRLQVRSTLYETWHSLVSPACVGTSARSALCPRIRRSSGTTAGGRVMWSEARSETDAAYSRRRSRWCCRSHCWCFNVADPSDPIKLVSGRFTSTETYDADGDLVSSEGDFSQARVVNMCEVLA